MPWGRSIFSSITISRKNRAMVKHKELARTGQAETVLIEFIFNCSSIKTTKHRKNTWIHIYNCHSSHSIEILFKIIAKIYRFEVNLCKLHPLLQGAFKLFHHCGAMVSTRFPFHATDATAMKSQCHPWRIAMFVGLWRIYSALSMSLGALDASDLDFASWATESAFLKWHNFLRRNINKLSEYTVLLYMKLIESKYVHIIYTRYMYEIIKYIQIASSKQQSQVFHTYFFHFPARLTPAAQDQIHHLRKCIAGSGDRQHLL